jgi:DNA-binding transcriptional MerR regulator
MAKRLDTTADAASVLGVVPDTVRHLARIGRLPVAVLTRSGLRLFDPDEVARLAAVRRLARAARR